MVQGIPYLSLGWLLHCCTSVLSLVRCTYCTALAGGMFLRCILMSIDYLDKPHRQNV